MVDVLGWGRHHRMPPR